MTNVALSESSLEQQAIYIVLSSTEVHCKSGFDIRDTDKVILTTGEYRADYINSV